jgi:hypothetical protein
MQNQTPPSLNIADLANLLTVVDYAAEQGAFKGWQTIQQVIVVREKLAAFVMAAKAAEEAAAAQAQPQAPAPQAMNFITPDAEEETGKKRARKATK